MPSTYTDRNRLEMQAPGENSDAWGEILNDGVIALLDASLDGMVSFTLSGSKTLSDEDGDTDESRCRFLNITSGTGGTVTIPDVEKWYLVRNNTSGTVTITTGTGTSGDVAAGGWAIVVSTGANTVFAINLTASPAFTGTPTAPTAASGTATTQIATTAFVDELYDVGVVSKSSSFTLALTDRATVIDYIGGAGDATIPTNASVAFPEGTTLSIINLGSGALTIKRSSGVVLRWVGSNSASTDADRTLGVSGMATLIKRDTDEWIVVGTVLS
jgi:hypothetical protein